MTNFDEARALKMARGFSFLELVIVIAIISVLVIFALNRYTKLLVVVERTSMEHDLGVMRSAIGMQVAAYFLAGNLAELEQLTNSNPMDLLAEKPKNYLGSFSQSQAQQLEDGSWYYDTDSQALIYLVRNRSYFTSRLSGKKRARLKIYPVYSDKQQGNEKQSYLSGLELRAMEPFAWQNAEI